MSVNVAVIGCGYWGPNLVRVLSTIPEVDLRVICDLKTTLAYQLVAQYARAARVEADYNAVANDPSIDAVALATPMWTHYSIAKTMLEAGKHVFVEKPLATSVDECRSLIDIAERYGRTLMVGHIFEYSPAVLWIDDYLKEGNLGKVQYLYSRRLNLGRIQVDLNAMWSFAPHDVSMLLRWLQEDPVSVSARGFSYVSPGVEDVVFMTLEFPSGVAANLHLSWLDPRKIREFTIVGSERMLVYDDVSADAKVQVYDKGVLRSEQIPPRDFGEFQLRLRTGDVVIPSIKGSEPLREECVHFVRCIEDGTTPRTDGQNGLRVVRVLEAADQSLRASGRPVEVGLALV